MADFTRAISPLLNLGKAAQPQATQPTQATTSDSLLAGLMAPMPQQTQTQQMRTNIGRLFGLDTRPPMEKLQEQLAGMPLTTAADYANAGQFAKDLGLPAYAIQFNAVAAKKRAEEQETARKNFNFTNLQNSLLRTARDDRDVDQIKAATTYEQLEAIRERLAPGGEASTSNYSIETAPGERSILALPTDKDGNIFYDNQWNKPDKLKAIKVGDDLSKVSSGLGGTPQAEKTVNPNPLIEHAIERKYIGSEPGNPDGERLLRAIQAGYVTSIEGVNKYFEGDITTPAAIQQRAVDEGIRKQQILSGAANELNTVQRALNLLDDPTTKLGGVFTLGSDLIALEGLTEDQIAFNSLVTSLKSDEALNRIEELKAVSAELGGEGTGLGSVQIKEFEALQSAIASIPENGNRAIWKPAIEKIKFHLMNITLVNRGETPYVDLSNPAYANSVMIDPDTGAQFIVLDKNKGSFYEVKPTPSISAGLSEMMGQ